GDGFFRCGFGGGTSGVMPARDTLQVHPCTLAFAIHGSGRSRPGMTPLVLASPQRDSGLGFDDLMWFAAWWPGCRVLFHGTVCGRDAAREPTGMYSRRVP